MDARQDQFAKETESLPNGENRRIYREQRPASTILGRSGKGERESRSLGWLASVSMASSCPWAKSADRLFDGESRVSPRPSPGAIHIFPCRAAALTD
jgi:hypothetical protein